MFSSQDTRALKNTIALQAAARWKARTPYRMQPSTPPPLDPRELQLHEQRQSNFVLRESLRPSPVVPSRKVAFERIVRNNELTFVPPSKDAITAGVPVARLQTIVGPGFQPEGFATGFLVSPHLLITNHHVFPDSESAKGCAANFQYERTAAGLQAGFAFALNPDTFYCSNEVLDYALVYVEADCIDTKISLNNFRFLPLIATKGKIIVGQPLSIIQYAAGGPKQYAYADNNVLDILEAEGFIQYATDTLQGSSGSPGFNAAWEVAALHHQGIPYVVNDQIMTIRGEPWDPDNMSDDDIQWIANEGISISRIVEDLKRRNFGTPQQQALLQELLALTGDPLINGAPVKNESITLPAILPSTMQARSETGIVLHFHGPTNVYVGMPTSSPAVVTPVTTLPTGDGFIEKKQSVDPDYDHRPGYDPNFLEGYSIKAPSVKSSRDGELFKAVGTQHPYVLKYHHSSLVMNKSRRLVMWTASNADYDPSVKSSKDRSAFGSESWIPDPRIPVKFQLTDAEFYKPATNIDRGHIVRRDDNCWGTTEKAIAYANADTYHWTNCTPQHERFNQSREGGYQGLWGKLEGQIQSQLKLVGTRAIQFAGPVLDDEDPSRDFGLGSVQYPLRFWKIIVINEADAGLSAYGFILDQSKVIDQYGLEEALLDFSAFNAQQVTVNTITTATGVLFDNQLYEADVMLAAPEAAVDGQETKRSFRSASQIFLKKSSAI